MAKKSNKTARVGEFARLHGVTPKTVREWRKAGHIVPSAGGIDVDKSNKRLAERPASIRGGAVKGPHAAEEPGAGQTYADAKRTKETFLALLAEHRRDKLADSLAPVELAVRLVTEDLDAIRARFRQVPEWIAPRLVGLEAAPIVATMILRAFRGALHDVSKQEDEPAWDGDLTESPLPDASTQVYVVTCDGEVKYSRRPKEVVPPVAETKKPRRRRRSSQAIEEAIAEAGAEDEVDNALIVAVERAVPSMTITEAKTRSEVAIGDIKRCEYQLLKKEVVRLDAVEAALSANSNGVKTNVMGIASKTAPRIALLNDATTIERVIAKATEEVLEDLADAKTLIGQCL